VTAVLILAGALVPLAFVGLLWLVDERAWRRALEENQREARRIADLNIERRRVDLRPIPGPGRLARYH
jgi:hypothetical protein